MIGRLLTMLFGGGAGAATGIIETFRPNAERSAERAANAKTAALEQFAAEFAAPRKSAFDRLVDGLNRLPRPALALGTVAFFALAMLDPVTFAQRMAPLELVPEELWWLLGAVVTFYFGARELSHARKKRQPADVRRVVEAMRSIEALRPEPEPDTVDEAAQDKAQARDNATVRMLDKSPDFSDRPTRVGQADKLSGQKKCRPPETPPSTTGWRSGEEIRDFRSGHAHPPPPQHFLPRLISTTSNEAGKIKERGTMVPSRCGRTPCYRCANAPGCPDRTDGGRGAQTPRTGNGASHERRRPAPPVPPPVDRAGPS